MFPELDTLLYSSDPGVAKQFRETECYNFRLLKTNFSFAQRDVAWKSRKVPIFSAVPAEKTYF